MTTNTRARYVWLVLATCALLTILESAHTALVARVHGERVNVVVTFLRHAPAWAALAVLIPVIGWGSRRLPLYGSLSWPAVAAHLTLGAMFPFVHSAITGAIQLLLTPGARVNEAMSPGAVSSGAFVMNVLLYWVIVGAHTVHALHRRHARDVEEAATLRRAAERLEGSLIDANLQALRWQLNPHFLFNALNSLSVLADEARAPRVVEVIGKLSALLRIALEQRDRSTTLEQEVLFLTRYLEFERVRFEDRLGVEWQLPRECLHAYVPALVLQPLVENAIKHGLSPDSRSAHIVIGAARSGGKLRLWVADRGPGLDDARGGGEGVGLRNTRDRLFQHFGERHSLRLESAPGRGVTATIVIPWSANGSEHALQED